MPFAATQMDPEIITLNEVSQKKTNIIRYQCTWNLKNSTKELIYKNYIKAIPDTDIDKEIDFSELNGTFIESEIMNVLHNQLISAIHECKINVHNLRVPILDKIKGQMLEDQYRKLSLERYFQEYENNWLISSIKRGISAQEKKQSTAIKHAKIPPLDLAMYYEDIEWVLDLLKRGARIQTM